MVLNKQFFCFLNKKKEYKIDDVKLIQFRFEFASKSKQRAKNFGLLHCNNIFYSNNPPDRGDFLVIIIEKS